jgi:metal transporter CNNM
MARNHFASPVLVCSNIVPARTECCLPQERQSLSRLRLEAAAAAGDKTASSALELRRDANFTLVTILMGNVAINVLLTMLADSVMAGVLAFLFSTVVITALGEIGPQAYFSRNALRAVAIFAPVLRLYRILLWPLAKPTALLLDAWVGTERVPWFRERELHNILRYHAVNTGSEVGRVEAIGAINFLALDDLVVQDQGKPLGRNSIVQLPFDEDRPVFPAIDRAQDDPFVRKLAASRKKWIVLQDEKGKPRLLLNANAFLRDFLVLGSDVALIDYCHRPAVVTGPTETLDKALGILATLRAQDAGHDETVILLWSPGVKRMITGSDVLRCLLSGMGEHEKVAVMDAPSP